MTRADPPAVRMGVDIGGTFTDIALETPTARHTVKVLTTPSAPEQGIIAGMKSCCKKAGIPPSAITQIIHGTTLATNALIERRGAETALITTQGFRDVIEMRTESRFEQYDLNLRLPDPLLPRQRRHTLNERISAAGKILQPLAQDDVRALAQQLAAEGIESIAVGLLHAYANPTHERIVRDVLQQTAPHITISLSSEVSPQMRECERFNTVVANAYIKPLMQRYLSRLREQLQQAGARCPVFLMHSGGGIISIESATEFPVRLVESGPAGGALYAATVAAQHGIDRALSFDMGGTTAKICLISNQTPKTSRAFEVARSYRFKKGSGMTISIPVIEMVEIGAGGGSLAHIDAMQQIRVGPESAGADPGPACYNRGGARPAVTDADLLLGKINSTTFAGGAIPLDASRAATALRATLGDLLKLDAPAAANALAEVVDENMANAARVHAVESGENIADYTMVAFGGAAPLHAGRLCEKLGIHRLLIPTGAGVGSAIGFLRAPFAFEATRGMHMPLCKFNAERVQTLLEELRREAEQIVRACDATAPLTTTCKAYMRYTGQGWEIPVTLPPPQTQQPNAEEYQHLFEQTYRALFGRTVDGMAVEISVWSVTASAPAPPPPPEQPTATTDAPPAKEPPRRLYNPATGKYTPAPTIPRATIQPGQTIPGPAAITEEETTTIVPQNFTAKQQPDGSIDIVSSTKSTSSSPPSQPPTPTPTNIITHQIIWNRLIAIVEEQAQALIRTAFSPSVREAGDLSAGVYDPSGNMLAQAITGTPGHVNAMAQAVAHFIRRIGADNIHDGDVYLTNDPWEGTGHLLDITVVTPVFNAGELIAYFACTAHVVDIGGRGFNADASSVHEEGLYLPIMKLIDRGSINNTLLTIIRANSREPTQLIGDLHALTACNDVGRRRLTDMLQEFNIKNIAEAATHILQRSHDATVQRIAALHRDNPTNTAATSEMTIDGYTTPITLRTRITIAADHISCDFTGTDGTDSKGINVPLVYTQAYACYALKCAIAPDIPNNAASLAPFHITAPPNSILNAAPPAPVMMRHIIGHMIPDVVFGALDKLIPNTVPAEGAGALCNFQLSLRPSVDNTDTTPTRAEILTFNSGGAGARPTADGLNATAFPSGVMAVPVEVTEHAGPVIIWRKELRPDSGGAGKHRGGLGQLMEIAAADGHQFDFSAMFDRVSHPARGRRGGGSGAPTTITRSDSAPMHGKSKQPIPPGTRIQLALPGGGGHGNPKDRDPAAIQQDLDRGYITPAAAKRDYGYIASNTADNAKKPKPKK